MAELKRQRRWVRFEPDLGNNLELPARERFFFEVASSLTKEELSTFRENFFKTMSEVRDEEVERLPSIIAEALRDVVRLGSEPLVMDGKAVESLEDYFGLFLQRADLGKPETMELTGAVAYLNSYSGSRSLFSGRLSGGATSTQPPSTGLGGSQTAAPRNGSNTSSSATSG